LYLSIFFTCVLYKLHSRHAFHLSSTGYLQQVVINTFDIRTMYDIVSYDDGLFCRHRASNWSRTVAWWTHQLRVISTSNYSAHGYV